MRFARVTATVVTSLVFLAAPGSARAGESPKPARPAKTAGPSKAGGRGGRTARTPDAAARRAIAGGRMAEDAWSGAETEELRALRDAERDAFAPAAPALSGGGPPELPSVLPRDSTPRVVATGVPPSDAVAPFVADAASDLSWLAALQMPDLPVRWDPRVVQYLEFFRDDTRGHAMFANLFRHSGRFRDMMRAELRKKGLPEDLVWVAMVESGFDPVARSASGAGGLWQFMPETGRIYGLTVDHWLDQRYSPELATSAAADLLGDLHRRFGSWELALAAYNMGYGGVFAVVRRYNTNDFWSLARTEGTIPWQTTLYVPKILAAAVVAHNLAAFGFGDMVVDAPVESDHVDVPAGLPLTQIAQSAGCEAKDVEGLNPELRAARTPPTGDGPYRVKVPLGHGAMLARAMAKPHKAQAVDRYVVRFGESLEQIATAHRTTPQRLAELNSLAAGEALRGGTTLLVPKDDASGAGAAPMGNAAPRPDHGASGPGDDRPTSPAQAPSIAPKESVVVPSDEFVYPDRQRVFYRVAAGDTPREIAATLHVAADDLDRWNALDPGARLQEGMTLQAFVPEDADLSHIRVLSEGLVHVVPVGSDEFFAPFELAKRVRRISVAAKEGDTLESIGTRMGVAAHTMEWINRRSRNDLLKAGDPVVLYVPERGQPPVGNAAPPPIGPLPNGPIPAAPQPDLLP